MSSTTPDLYIATYSQVDVYESEINDIPLMRRCSDDWVNATQILKIAGFGKAQRTRILEKEVHPNIHQKIQGGYGRFQGTWIPLNFARELAKKHNLLIDNVKVLYYNPITDQPLKKRTKNKSSSKNKDSTNNSSSGSANTTTSNSNDNNNNKLINDKLNSPDKKRKAISSLTSNSNTLKQKKSLKKLSASSSSSNLKKHLSNNFENSQLNNIQNHQLNHQNIYASAGSQEISNDQQSPSQIHPRAFTFTQNQNQFNHQQQGDSLQKHQLPPSGQFFPPPPSFQTSQSQPNSTNQQFQQNFPQLPHQTFNSISTTDGSQEDFKLNRSNSDTSATSDIDNDIKRNQQLQMQQQQMFMSVQQQQQQQQMFSQSHPPTFQQAQFLSPQQQMERQIQQIQQAQQMQQQQAQQMQQQQQMQQHQQAQAQAQAQAYAQAEAEAQAQAQAQAQVAAAVAAVSKNPIDDHNSSMILEGDSKQEDIDPDFDYYTEKLINFFSYDNQQIPSFLIAPPDDFDINKPIDNEGHTPLHWASALGSLNVLQILINNHANPLIFNESGMNCLSKLLHFTNSFDMKNFKEILKLLRECLIVPDEQGRTPLHYLMEISDQENKFDCISYYLDEIFNFINEQQREARKSVVNLDKDKNLLKILINHKDNKGNTALHLAANNNNRFFMKKLLLNGADYHLKNNLGESAKNKIPVTLILEAKEHEKENELKLLQEQQQQQQLAQLQQQQQQQQLAQLQQQQHVQLHAQQEVQLQAQLQAQLHAQQQAQIQAQFQAVAQAQMRDQLQAAAQLQSDVKTSSLPLENPQTNGVDDQTSVFDSSMDLTENKENLFSSSIPKDIGLSSASILPQTIDSRHGKNNGASGAESNAGDLSTMSTISASSKSGIKKEKKLYKKKDSKSNILPSSLIATATNDTTSTTKQSLGEGKESNGIQENFDISTPLNQTPIYSTPVTSNNNNGKPSKGHKLLTPTALSSGKEFGLLQSISVKKSSVLTKTLKSFNNGFPELMSSLCETFDKELADKDEEIEENIKNINNVKNEVQITNKRNKRLLKNILGGIDENSGELIVNSNFDELISIVDRENEQIMKDPSSTSSSALLTLGEEDISPVDISKKINEEVQDRVNNYKEALVEKSNVLIKLAERSQALELACLVRDEEGNIDLSEIKSADNEHDDNSTKVKSEKDGGNNSTSQKDPGSSNSTSRASTFSDHDHDLTMDSSFDSENGSNIIGERTKSGKNKLTLAIELTLLQLNRRKLVNSLVTAYSGTKSILDPVQNDGLGITTDSKSIKDSESSLGDDDIESMTIDNESIDTVTDGILSKFDGSRLHLFKRLISNICDLQIEEIDEKLLSAIEMRLLDNGKSPALGATPRFV